MCVRCRFVVVHMSLLMLYRFSCIECFCLTNCSSSWNHSPSMLLAPLPNGQSRINVLSGCPSDGPKLWDGWGFIVYVWGMFRPGKWSCVRRNDK